MVLCPAARIRCSVRAGSVLRAIMLGTAALVSGCGASTDEARAQHEARTAAHTDAATLAATDVDMGSAVSAVASATPVSLKVRLSDAALVCQVLRLELDPGHAPL